MTLTLSPESMVRLHRLTEVSRALTWAPSLDGVLELAADCCVDLLDAKRVVVFLEGDDGALRPGAARGVDEAALDGFSVRLDERIASHLDPLFGAGARARFLGAPIVLRGRVRGLLAVDRGTDGSLGDSEEWLLSALADQTAMALEGAREEKARVALEAQVDAMERSRSDTERALKMAGHDLRTPLNSMQGYLELLASGVFGTLEDRQVDIVHRVQQIGRHLNAVLENALEMARLSTHHGEVPLTRVRARDVAAEALAMVEPQAEKAGLRTSLEVEENLWLSADPDRLRQVLLHLLDNGVKYAPAGTAIAVRCGERTDAGWGCLLVADEGHGIPPDQAEAIFEPGHRIGGGSDPGGTGLGLSIARGLVREMGGELRLMPPDGRGATFELRLRLTSPPAD